MKIYIYALKDNDTIFYVGRTSDHKRRMREHLSEANLYREYLNGLSTSFEGNRAKCSIIIQAQNSERNIDMEILDEWDAPTEVDANRLEDAWIAKIRPHHPIKNYIYSRRQNTNWYKARNHHGCSSPDEYIKKLKLKHINNDGDNSEWKRRIPRKKLVKLSRKSIKLTKKSRK